MSCDSQGGTCDRAKRKSLLTKTPLHNESGGRGDARVRNLSARGLGGVTDIAIKPGQNLVIILNGIGPVRGRIAWVDGKKFGMEFDKAIDLDRLEMTNAPITHAPERFSVASRFQPVTDYKRPGFTHRR
ncbi:PilZ domain-containing protein [Parasphingopyxis lamellibrachiae]|uniref:PilZ domain-containing protein n=1 Tax=Parasphingopyxis lamellibrachiae TaxID=680125 RepID=A0A3D9FCH1_9SPHN|nr:PilZ domain-containing protein [Parasphingopyxis lamellibrachiae]